MNFNIINNFTIAFKTDAHLAGSAVIFHIV